MNTERDTVYAGIKIGEHSFEPAKLIDEVRERAVDKGFRVVYLRPQGSVADVSSEDLRRWAEYFRDNKIYFFFGNLVQAAPEGKRSQLSRENAEMIREIAGEYFIGESIREPGTTYAAKARGYFIPAGKSGHRDPAVIRTDLEDMEAAHKNYYQTISEFIRTDREMGIPSVVSVEATALTKYNIEAGVDLPVIEVMPGNPDVILPSVRGAVRGYNKDAFGALIAHEWYGGFRHDDTLKRKRLELGTKFVYMSGAKFIMLESGDECISSYGHKYGVDSEICEDYRRAFSSIKDYMEKDHRPKGGPKTKFAFVFGLHDAWPGFCQSSVWNQFGREEWGHSDAEASWRILDELSSKRSWGDNANYGDNDLSSSPAYGTYDILPIESDIDVLSKYDHLVFLGWNTMTDENMDKLTEYVRRGGRLLMSGAHLNYSAKRNGEYIPPSPEKLKELFGISYNGNIIRTNNGVKLEYESIDKRHIYSSSKNFICDPLFSAGYVEYMDVELCGARALGYGSESFARLDATNIAVIENRVGEGVATLITARNYPGNTALYPLYRSFVREMVTSSARECEIRVIASDKLRYCVYEGNKMYLLNTDYDLPITVKVIYNGNEQMLTLESLELKSLEL